MTPPELTQRPASPANYGSRGGQPVDLLVIHTTQGTAASALWWFADAAASSSAHFVVGKDGCVWQCVPLDRAAWHAGNGNVNRRSIGIECEGDCWAPDMWTEPLLRSLCDLVAWLVAERGIPPDRNHIIGHSEVPDPKRPGLFGGVNHHEDPGPFIPWARIVAAALAANAVA